MRARLYVVLLCCVASSACSLLFGLDGYDSGSGNGAPDAQPNEASTASSSGLLPERPDAEAGASSSSSSGGGPDDGGPDAGQGFCAGRVTQFCTDFNHAVTAAEGFSSREGPDIFSLVAGADPGTQWLQAIIPVGSSAPPNSPTLNVSVTRAPRLRFEFSFRMPSATPYKELTIWGMELHDNHILSLTVIDGVMTLEDYTGSVSSVSAVIAPDDAWHRVVLDLTPTSLQGTIDNHEVSLPLVDEAPNAGTPIVLRIGGPYIESLTTPVTVAWDDIAVSTIP